MFRDFNASNKSGTCLWCGRKLRRKAWVERERTNEVVPAVKACPCGGTKFHKLPEGFECASCERWVASKHPTRVTSREYAYDKPGDYGDGHFCGLRCGYDFAVAMADSGERFKESAPNG